MEERRTTLEGLEVGALAVDRRIDEQVARCVAAREDPVALRQELGGLAGMKGQRAEFAYCLFSVDLARMGEPEAKANFARYAGILLEAHRDPDLTRYLLGDSEELARRWEKFVPLLMEFDRARRATEETTLDTPAFEDASVPGGETPGTTQPNLPKLEPGAATTLEGGPDLALEATLEHCFSARGDAAALRAAMESLAAFPQTDREEFAHCLFDLELVRLGVDEAKPEFAGRANLLLEAYRDGERAKVLLGGSLALRKLWDDVRPYLEEFFEPPEEEPEYLEEVVEEAPAAIEVAPDPEELQLSELEIIGQSARPPPPPPPSAADMARPMSKPPPPPPMEAKEPERAVSLTPGKGVVRRVSSITAKRLSMPPMPAPQPEAAPPSKETLEFWKFAELKLELLPDENGQLSGKQAFDVKARENRTALKHLVRELIENFPTSPESRALACLTELYLAAQLKEKTLFGKPNDKRHHALQEALSLLTADAQAAGHAAVLFENDGPDTIAHFGDALVAMHRYLAHCMRNNLDPLSAEAVKGFEG